DKLDNGEVSDDPFGIHSGKVRIHESVIKIINENIENPEIFTFLNVNLSGNSFNIKGPDIAADIQKLSFQIKDGMLVENMKPSFSLSSANLNFDDLVLQAPESDIKGFVDPDFAKNGMSDFENDVTITANLVKSKLASNDLNTFYNG